MAKKETFSRQYLANFNTPKLKFQFFSVISEKKQEIHDKWYDEDYVIVYIEDGKIDILCNGKSAQLNSGDIFLCKPYEKFNLIALEVNKKMTFSTISFHPTLFDNCDKESKIYRIFNSRNEDELCIYRKEEAEKLKYLFEQSLEYIKKSWHEDVYKSIVTLILFEISAIFDKTHQQHPAKFSHEYDLKIFSYIQSRILTPITVTDVMNGFYVSRWYIDKVCKKFYDSNFTGTLKRERMWAARGFMVSKKTNDLHEIAELCGYNDYSAFYKNYKSFFGISPKDDLKYFKEHKEFYRK